MYALFASRFFSLFLFLFAILFVSCQKQRTPEMDEKDPIRIGVFQSMSGSEASYGQDAMIGIHMAEEEINSKGGVLGRPIQLLVRDNQSKAGETSSIVRELISRDRVVALIGEVASGRTLEAAPIAQRYRIPLVVNSACNDKITKAGNFVFRVSYRDSQQGIALAHYINSLGKKRAAVLVDISRDHSTTLAKSFGKQFTALGGKIVEQYTYNAGDKDFSGQLTAIQNSNADCLFLPGYYTDCGPIMKQAQSMGIKLDTFGGDGWDSSDLVRVAGDATEGAVFTDSFSAQEPDPIVQDFVAKYKKKFGKNKQPMAFTANGFDALMLLVDAIQRAGSTDPKAIRDALAATNGYQGVSGKITYDKDRDPSKSVALLRIRNGEFEFIKRESL